MILKRHPITPVSIRHLMPLIETYVVRDNLTSFPGFQTGDLSHEPLFRPFVDSFREACITIGMMGRRVQLWAYCETAKRQDSYGHDKQWHDHGQGKPVVSGVMFLTNPEGVGTQFATLEQTPGDCWVWNLFPSETKHRPGKLSTDSLRISVAADLRND